MKLRRGCIKRLFLLFYIMAFSFLFYMFYKISSDKVLGQNEKERSNSVSRKNTFATNELSKQFFPESNAVIVSSKIHWSEKVSYIDESKRTGLGEGGVSAVLPDANKILKQEIWDHNGFDGLLSSKIALNRFIKDIRHPLCKGKKYNAIMPTVSVVIPFFEEHFETLLRTVVSVANRSPPSLLKEIILVDDGSTINDLLGEPLEEWLRTNQPLAKVVRNPVRKGLIDARQEGIKAATGDVFVVLDSHCEVMTGWLPPLIEPIVTNPRTAVCPLIDGIKAHDFSYSPQDEGGRGFFDWRLYYKRLDLREQDRKNYPQPFENPVMNGGLFAMNRAFFWELGGYDTGIKIWGGEQYELSFKIWQCGGRLLDAPCSRVGHIFRSGGSKRPAAKNAGDFISKNYKRVAAVWMDEYAEAIYKKKPNLRHFPPGDISAQLEIRERLKCKPFKWFLENVAPDAVKIYPPFEPPDFANGTVKSQLLENMCIDSANKQSGNLIVYSCHGYGPQYFSLSYQKIIERDDEQFCWAVSGGKGSPPVIQHCTINPPPSHIWSYDPDSLMIQNKRENLCLDVERSHPYKLFMNDCNLDADSQKWEFKNVNRDMIKEKYRDL